ncbi:MAG: S-layer homology domain-containing protein [Clostridiales bacterium]|nr:S-layer homology domain-containing protein [Clostridiales bacterium]
MKRKLTNGALLAIMFLICLVPAFSPESFAGSKGFPDTRGHWAERFIAELSERGAISGMPDGNFQPNEKITFPQFVTIIIREEFGDIKPTDGNWASGYIQKALELGIILPDEATNTKALNRYDAVRIVNSSLLWIYNEQPESDVYDLVKELTDYPSCKSCRDPFDNEIGQCMAKGIITGRPGPMFDGEANLTRAEASVILLRAIDPSYRVVPDAR